MSKFFHDYPVTIYLLSISESLNASIPADVTTNATFQKVLECSATYREVTAAQAIYSVADVDTDGSTSQVANSILNSTKEAVQPFLDFLQGTGMCVCVGVKCCACTCV